MKYFGLILLMLTLSQICLGQVILNQKEAERIARESAQEMKISKQYFTAHDKCRELMKQKNHAQAEVSCRLAVTLAEKLPNSRSMEKHSAYKWLGYSLVWQQKSEEAIPILEKSLEVAKIHLDETDAETGEVYFLIGQANQLLRRIKIASDFYIKAEKVYRTAFVEIGGVKVGDDEIRSPYPRAIKNILEAHLILLKNAELVDDAAKVEKRLAETKVEFAKFLEN
jgi:tetratricopeptide (TPR) repeat protein